MTNKIRLAMVSYLNAIPFKYGLELKLKDDIILLEKNPAECADMFFQGEVDVALLPVGALIGECNFTIFSNTCIGSEGDVQTVCLFSDCSLEDIHTVYLDEHSRTSALLTQLMFAENNFTQVKFVKCKSEDILLKTGEAKLMIGDKVFNDDTDYNYVIDLSKWWQDLTGLPFVFAVWVRLSDISVSMVDKLVKALSYGVDHITEVLSTLKNDIDLAYYFKYNISYDFDDSKKEALQLFFKKIEKYKIN